MKKRCFCVVVAAAVLFLSCPIGLAKEKVTAQEWFQMGEEFERQTIYGEAVKMYTEAILLDRNFAEAYFNRGRARMASDKTNPVLALRDFDRAIALDPTNVDAYYQRGLVYAFIINNANARDDMQTAARLGHVEAQKWLIPYEETRRGRGEGVSPVSVKTEASPAREVAQKGPAAERSGKSGEKEGKPPNFGEYLSSKSGQVIHFDHNRSEIGPQYHALLDEVANVLKEKMPEAKVTLAGHTDSTGRERYNTALSVRRAQAVEFYLRDNHEIPPERMTVQGRGQNAPIASNETEEGRAKNRRVEIILDENK